MQSREHTGQDGIKGKLSPDLAAYFISSLPQQRPTLSLRFSGVLSELAEGIGRD